MKKPEEKSIKPFCPSCNGDSVKAGKTNVGAQRYRCKLCKKVYQYKYSYKAYNHPDLDLKILSLLRENCGINSIKRLLGVSKNTVLDRIKKMSASLPHPVIYKGHTYEVDELCTYVGNKRRVCWVAYAYDRQTKKVVALRVGNRTKKMLEGLIRTLLISNAKAIYTDGLGIYKSLIPPEIHKTIRYGTSRIERVNLLLRNDLKRLNRRTMCYSKSKVMLEAVLRLYFWSCSANELSEVSFKPRSIILN